MRSCPPNRTRLGIILVFAFFTLSISADAQEISTSGLGINKHFRKNLGQWDDSVLYRSRSNGAAVAFLPNAVSYCFSRPVKTSGDFFRDTGPLDESVDRKELMVWNVEFSGSNLNSEISEKGHHNSRMNYFIGSDFSRHVINTPEYREIIYNNIYPETDLHYYFTGTGDIKYDFVLKPNAEANHIRQTYRGVQNLAINRNGQLEVTTPWGTLIEEAPYSYQIIDGVEHIVQVTYQLINDSTVGFAVHDSYDKNHELIIDPIVLKYGTHLGNVGGDGYIHDVKVDENGIVYATGWYTDNFPTTPGVYTSPGLNGAAPNHNMFAAKLSDDGSTLLFGCAIGSSATTETGNGVDFTSNGELIAVGSVAGASNFPLTGGSFPGGGDGVAIKLSGNGSQLMYSVPLGGSGKDAAISIATSSTGEAWITGSAVATGFKITPGAYSNAGGSTEAFVVKLDQAGNTDYSTVIGMPGKDVGMDIEVYNDKDVYVVGSAANIFPRVPASAYSQPGGGGDIFLIKLINNGSALGMSVFMGGMGQDGISLLEEGKSHACLDLDQNGNAYFITRVGTAWPTTPGAFAGPGRGGAAIAKFTPTGDLVFSTYIGVPLASSGGIAVNSTGNQIFFNGHFMDSKRNNLVTGCGIQSTYTKSNAKFVGKLKPDGSGLEYLSLFDGWDTEYWASIDIREKDTCVIEVVSAVTSHSHDLLSLGLTTPGAYSPTHKGEVDEPSIFKLKPEIDPDFDYTKECANIVKFRDLTTGNCIWKDGPWQPNNWHWSFGDGATSTEQNPVHAYATPGTYDVKLFLDCPCDSIVKQVTIDKVELELDLGEDIYRCAPSDVSLYALPDSQTTPQPDTQYKWSTGESSTIITVNKSGTYWVEASNSTCTVYDTVKVQFLDATEVKLNDTTICNDGSSSVLLDAGEGKNYQWSTGATTRTVETSSNGKVWVEVFFDDEGKCSASDTAEITFKPMPEVSIPDTTFCGNGVELNAQNPGAKYNWSTSETTQKIRVSNSGEYWVEVTVNGCSSSDTANITMSPAGVYPKIISGDVCLGNTTFFQDSSYVDQDSVVSWEWDFGDGNTSTEVNPQHEYGSPGSFTVTLTVANSQGCSGVIKDTVEVYPLPLADFIPTTACEGDTTKFMDQSTVDTPEQIVKWDWNFGDDGGSSGQNTSYTFGTAGEYEVQLVVETEHACIDTVVKQVTVYPLPVVNFSPEKQGCTPIEVQFTDSSTVSEGEIIIWNWDLGDGSVSTAQHPFHTYTNPGSYDVSLTVISDGRCSGSLTKTKVVQVFAIPNADFVVNPEEATIAYPYFEFTDLSSSDVISWNWDFGDDIGLSDVQHPAYSYSDTGTYTITLTVANEFGCSDSAQKTVAVNPEWEFYVPNVFTPNDRGGNETFIGKGFGVINHQMFIYDRWGKLIYKTDETPLNEATPWNGRYNNNLTQTPEDTYVYVIQIEDVFNKNHQYVGHVTVIR